MATPSRTTARSTSDPLIGLWEKFSLHGSAADAAVQALRAAILGGVIAAGVRLSEEDLASRFSVSRTPIREAILRLEAEMLVQRIGRRGAVVSRVTEDEILDVYVVRAVLDGLAARLAARSATDNDLARLRAINGRLSALAGTRKVDAMAYLGLDFHEALGNASQNKVLPHFIVQAHNRVRQYGGTTLTQAGRAQQAVREHEQILDAVAQRDETAAERLARDHMTQSMVTRLGMLFAVSPDGDG